MAASRSAGTAQARTRRLRALAGACAIGGGKGRLLSRSGRSGDVVVADGVQSWTVPCGGGYRVRATAGGAGEGTNKIIE